MTARMETDGLRGRLRDRTSPLLATFVLVPRVEIVEALAHTGFDAVILDFEHGPFTVGELSPLVAAAHGAGIHVIVRVGERTASTIGNVLDAGVDGILVPHVDGTTEAAAAVAAVRFPPAGSRSINPYVRAARYDGGASFMDEANRSVATIVMVEGADGLAALADIAATPGIDGIFVGPVDLSAALGYPGEPEHPQVLETITGIFETVARSGVAAATYCPTPESARRWLDHGARLVALSADMAMAMDGFRGWLRAVGDPSRS